MLKIFWNDNWLNYSDKHIPMEYFEMQSGISTQESYSRCMNPEEADCIIFPVWYEARMKPILKELEQWVVQQNKVLILFQHDDLYYRISGNKKNIIILRHAFQKSEQKNNEIVFPSKIDDYVKSYFNGNLPIRNKRENPPIIGFCGNSHIQYSGQYVRSLVLSEMIKSKFIRTNFILRPFFSGLMQGEEIAKVRKEMLINMVESDYCLVVRGAGNFSLRFYEVLCMGKIPVFVNTDTALPLEDKINYKDCGIWIEQDEIPFIGEKIEWRHREIPNEEYISMQQRNRVIWEDYLQWETFFTKHLPYTIKNKLEEMVGKK